MKRILRKGFLLGLGITSLATNKIEREMKKTLKEHNITREEASIITNEFINAIQRHKETTIKTLNKELDKAEKKLATHIKKHKKSI